MFKLKCIYLTSIIFFCLRTEITAQENQGLGIRLSQNYPLGSLSEFYNSGVGFEIGYCGIDDDYISEISIGYIRMTPIKDIIHYQYTDDYGDVHNAFYEFDNYVIIPINFSVSRKLRFSDNQALFIGLGFGLVNYKYSDTNNSETGNTAAIMPKIGFTTSITEGLSLLLDVKYNYQPFDSRSTWGTGISLVF